MIPRVSLVLARLAFAALVEQGIEPHPGPRRHRKIRLLSRGFSAWSLNTGGAPKVWEFLNLVVANNVSLAVVQEVRMKQNELDAFTSAAWCKGFKAFHVKGPDANTRRDLERPTGGVLLLVRRGIPHTTRFQITMPGGQAIAVWAGGLLLIGVYNPPNDQQADFLEALHSGLADFSSCPFLVVGDWNLTPSENPFVDASGAAVVAAPMGATRHNQLSSVFDDAALAPVMDFGRVDQHVYDAHPDMDDANWLPTRWNANRCVDYAISNLPLHCISACLGEEKLSDHRILKLLCEKCLSTAMSSKLRKCDRYFKPEGMLQDEWRNLLDSAWKEQCWITPALLNTQESVDDAWSSFCITLEKAFRVAHARVRGLRFRPLPKSCRPRNSSPCFIRPTAPVTRHPESFLPCLGIRQARNRFRANRFSEPVTNNERSLCLWRDKLLACDKEVFKWLRGRSGAPTYNLYWNDSPVSMSPLEGIQCLKDFWCSVWNRERPDFANQYSQSLK